MSEPIHNCCLISGFNIILSRDYIACELCREPLHELSVEDRQAHYEAHFNNGDGLEANELDVQLAVSEHFIAVTVRPSTLI